MARAKPFIQASLRARSGLAGFVVRQAQPVAGPGISEFASAEIDRTVAPKARLPSGADLDSSCVIKMYKLQTMANKQETPASVIATLKPLLKATHRLLQNPSDQRLRKQVSERLAALPQSIRFELQTPGLEVLLIAQGGPSIFDRKIICQDKIICQELSEAGLKFAANIERRIEHYQLRVRRNRPQGAGEASRSLRRSLLSIRQHHRPDESEAQRCRWAADLLRKSNVPFPDEKKNKKRFVGTPANIDGVRMMNRQRSDAQTKKARARARRLAAAKF
jgi:hypothetical protein